MDGMNDFKNHLLPLHLPFTNGKAISVFLHNYLICFLVLETQHYYNISRQIFGDFPPSNIVHNLIRTSQYSSIDRDIKVFWNLVLNCEDSTAGKDSQDVIFTSNRNVFKSNVISTSNRK